MNLKEEIHRSIEKLDSHALGYVYEQVRMLLQMREIHDKAAQAPSLESVLLLTSATSDSWSDSGGSCPFYGRSV